MGKYPSRSYPHIMVPDLFANTSFLTVLKTISNPNVVSLFAPVIFLPNVEVVQTLRSSWTVATTTVLEVGIAFYSGNAITDETPELDMPNM
jgi:hypothetical protein